MRRWAVLGGSMAVVAGAELVVVPSSSPQAAETLTLRGTLSMVSLGIDCPAEAGGDASNCRARTGKGSFSGLGAVSETYIWAFKVGPPTCPSDLAKLLATTGRLVVAGKGEIHFALADGAGCIDVEPIRNEPQDFRITGGTGVYAGASGSGIVERTLGNGRGTETWTGTLVATEVKFDVTPPTLTGAKPKTVRAPKGAKSVRVPYTVTASDAEDGQVPVVCLPRPGSRFPIGRTVVKCSATDSSANTAAASFTVAVKAPR
jgi:HYR domain